MIYKLTASNQIIVGRLVSWNNDNYQTLVLICQNRSRQAANVRAGVWIQESLEDIIPARDKSSAWYVTSPLYPWLHNSPRKLHYYTAHTTARLIREVRGRLIRSCLGKNARSSRHRSSLQNSSYYIYNVTHVYTYIFNNTYLQTMVKQHRLLYNITFKRCRPYFDLNVSLSKLYGITRN